MEYIPCRERTFPFELPVFYINTFKGYLRWLKHLVERIGYQSTLAIWTAAIKSYDVAGIREILSSGWHPLEQNGSFNLEQQLESALEAYIHNPVQGLYPVEARQIVEGTPPLVQIMNKFRIVNHRKQISAYHALQLRFDWTASLAERLIDHLGKEGELIIYDLVSEGRLLASAGETGSVSEFIKEFVADNDPDSLYAAALETEVIQVSENEAIIHIKECEWARFFQEHHPRVGYLMACSTDELAYKAYNSNLRMQRTSTLMEGGDVCDFRVYGVD